MFTDTIGFELKVAVYKHLVTMPMYTKLPSNRETQIQVDKLARMTKKFAAKFPPQMILSTPLKKINKMRGQERHLVNQQCKKVDRACAKLMGEMILDAMKVYKAPGKLSKGQLKMASQKYVEFLNAQIHKSFQKQLKVAFSATAGVLGGGKLSE
jgi:hypothetical protein